MSDANQAYERLIGELREISLLNSVAAVLRWDERTQLPVRGAEHRANQLSLLARMTHERFTSPRIGEWLAAVEGSDLTADRDGDAAVNVRETRRSYDKSRKLPPSLVQEMTRTSVLAQKAWVEARDLSQFAIFEPWLAKTIDLKRQEAECVGYETHLYDALLDDYEPRETTANLRQVFVAIRTALVELVGRVQQSPRKASSHILHRRYPRQAQERLAAEAAALIGFDFTAGRLDVSTHPFCTGIGPGDTRLTTRYDENYFGDAFFSVLHETGHGLYEQGLGAEHFGTPRGRAISLGIHESQSRLLQNSVGRSRGFWRFMFPKAREAFPEALSDVTEDDFFFAINDTTPVLIRTEADEATYELHILLRFELEQALLSGELSTADLPAAWNARMQEYLHLTPPDDAHGCLQDIHWSNGAFGYFPTYTLGNLYAAQFMEQARTNLGDLEAQFARGEFAPLVGWLREKIHRHGRRYTARRLVKEVTGHDLSADPLINRHDARVAELYGV